MVPAQDLPSLLGSVPEGIGLFPETLPEAEGKDRLQGDLQQERFELIPVIGCGKLGAPRGQ